MDNQFIIKVAEQADAPAIQRLLRSAMLTYCAESGISTAMLEAMTESVESVAHRIKVQHCYVVMEDGISNSGAPGCEAADDEGREGDISNNDDSRHEATDDEGREGDKGVRVAMGDFPSPEAVGTITVGIRENPLSLSFSDKTDKSLRKYSKIAYISRFAVKQDLRKGGMGLNLISECERFAAEAGCDALLLHCAVTNSKMNEFYARRGFVLLDHEDSRGYPRGLFVKELG